MQIKEFVCMCLYIWDWTATVKTASEVQCEGSFNPVLAEIGVIVPFLIVFVFFVSLAQLWFLCSRSCPKRWMRIDGSTWAGFNETLLSHTAPPKKEEQGTVGVQLFCIWLSLKTSFFFWSQTTHELVRATSTTKHKPKKQKTTQKKNNMCFKKISVPATLGHPLACIFLVCFFWVFSMFLQLLPKFSKNQWKKTN